MKAAGARILLTGAAGGIGRLLAVELARRGAVVALAGRNREALDATAATIQAAGGRCQVVVADLLAPDGPETLAVDALNALGRIDILINNAGTSAFTPFESMSPEQITALVNTNLTAPLRLTRALLPAMLEARRGQIVNVGSGLGAIGFPCYAAYSASKFGLRGFSEALLRELADTGVEVTHVAPRATRTDLNSPALYQFAQATKMAMDEPEAVARTIADAMEAGAARKALGGAEKFFARLNALLPTLVDKSLAAQGKIARQLLGKNPS